MAEIKFTPIFSLNELSQEQRDEYYLAACKYFGVPPELNVLRLTYVDSKNGPANLVLCATKGATDIIRNNLKISVKALTDKTVNGSYVVTATGENKDGRMEMAFGSFYIDGLKGQDLDNGIMTAQTRALKRMTLQFAGGGLTDESEVELVATAGHKMQASKPAAAQPTAKPNTAAGEIAKPFEHTTPPPKDKETTVFPTVAQIEAQKALAAVKPEILAQASSENVDAFLKSQNPPNKGGSLQEITPAGEMMAEPPAAPKRRKRETATFNKPFSLEPDIAAAEPLKTVVVYETPLVAEKPITQAIAEAQKVPVEIQVPAPTIDPVKINELRTQLFKYTNELLPKSGLVSDEGAPAAMKFRKFVVNRYKGLPSLNHLSIEQWQDLYSFMDSYLNDSRGVELVKIINESWTNA